jgi:hydrogenase-4 component B
VGVLTLVGLGFLALLAMAVLGLAGRAPRAFFLTGAAAMLLFGVASLVALTGSALPGLDATALPFGPPWAPSLIAIDPLSGWFLLILGLVGGAACLFGAASPPPSRAEAVGFPLFLAGMAIALIAADGFTLLLGFEMMSLAAWAMIAARNMVGPGRRAARLYLGFAAFSGLCLVGTFALLSTAGLSFAAIRAAPPEGWRAACVLLLVLLGAGSKADLVPFHVWVPVAYPAATTPVCILMSGAMVKVAVYVMLRVLLDLCGPAQPAWWGVPLIFLGAGTALLGALRANLECDTKAILACSTLENIGLIVVAIGLVLVFRGSDLAPLAALGLAAALLHALNHASFKSLLFLCAGAVEQLAASRDPDRLGGLVHRMPWVAGCAFLGALSAAALPPLSGFASEWLLLQGLIQAFRISDMSFQLVAAATLAVVGMAIGLGAAAMVRFLGLVFLGRPRTPRSAGAPDVVGLMRVSLLLPGLLCLALGPLAALALGLAGGPIRQLLGPGALVPRLGLDLALGDTGSRYMGWAVILALVCALTGLVLLIRRHSGQASVRGPAWGFGFMPPPPHLPFGDPLSQVSAAGLSQPIRQSLGGLAVALRQRQVIQPPGAPEPAQLRVDAEDRGFTQILYPLARGRRWLARAAELLRGLTLRTYLKLTFGTLIFLLTLIAWLERG